MPPSEHTISNVEIFRAGDYGEAGEYDNDDLDQIVSSYQAAFHEAPVTVDHEQHGPALGWIAGLRRIGSSIFADLQRIPEEFYDLLRQGAYKKRSVEIYLSGSETFKEAGGFYLRAVTFLGASAPRVKGMADIKFADAARMAFEFKEDEPHARIEIEGPFRRFTQPLESPGGHKTIVRDDLSGSTLSHYHEVFLDADRNGFTGKDLEYGEFGNTIEGRSGHIHKIKDGVIQVAGAVEHDHSLLTVTVERTGASEEFEEGKISEPNDSESKESDDMAKEDSKKKEADAPTGEPVAKASDGDVTTRSEFLELTETVRQMGEKHTREMKEKNEELEVLRTQNSISSRRSFMDAHEVLIDAEIDKAINLGSMAPGTRSTERAHYINLCETVWPGIDDAQTAGKPDKAKPFQEILENHLAGIRTRPAILQLGDHPTRAVSVFNEPDTTDGTAKPDEKKDPEAYDKWAFNESQRYVAREKCSFAEALRAVSRPDYRQPEAKTEE